MNRLKEIEEELEKKEGEYVTGELKKLLSEWRRIKDSSMEEVKEKEDGKFESK